MGFCGFFKETLPLLKIFRHFLTIFSGHMFYTSVAVHIKYLGIIVDTATNYWLSNISHGISVIIILKDS